MMEEVEFYFEIEGFLESRPQGGIVRVVLFDQLVGYRARYIHK